MLSEIDAEQLAEWMAAYRLEGWGPERDDLRALFLADAITAPHRKGGGHLNPRQYFRHLYPEQSDEDIAALVKQIFGAPS